LSDLDGAPSGASRVVLHEVGQVFGTGDRRVEALAGIDLTLEPGELVCIVGPSGCGKTTLLQILAGFVAPTSGTAEVGGLPVTGPGPDRGVVFQQPNLYPWLTVRGNVAFGPRMRHVRKRQRNAEADRLLELVGLDEFAGHRPYELSGGMQQRCQIARVLASDPAILLMDEPFGALDALTRERMQLELRRIWEETGKTIVFITHSVEEAVFLGTRVLVMSPRPGRVVVDETSPLGDRPRDRALRTDADFVAFRERIAAHIDAGAEAPPIEEPILGD
jgi:ABC-type nitrate/sulfonate/bicarbonate transport system ATPase subunit